MRIRGVICCVAGLLMSFAARAEDLTTRTGQTYTNISVRQIEPDGLTLKHDGGVTTVRFPELSDTGYALSRVPDALVTA